MVIQGEHWLAASPEVVWNALHDEGALRQTIPGCQELTQTTPHAFSGAASVGIGPIKGLYRGTLELTEERPHSSAELRVETRSGHAEISGSGSVHLEASDGGTLVKYEGEAKITGALAVVGHRLLPSASKLLTQQFLKNVETLLAEKQLAGE